MKIKLENENGTYTVKNAEDLPHISEYFNQLIIPVLLAAGFSSKTIKDALEQDYGL